MSGPKPKKKKTSNFIVVEGVGPGPANKYDFDPRRGEAQLLLDAQRKADFKEFYRGETSRSRYKKAGGKISKYYKDGGQVMTGRNELTPAQKNLPEMLQKKILAAKKKK